MKKQASPILRPVCLKIDSARSAPIFLAIGPAVLAYRCRGLGVQRARPALARFFANLTPLFAALMSTVFLGDSPPRWPNDGNKPPPPK